MKRILIPIIILLLQNIIFCQKKDPYKILESVKSKFENVKDYEADIHVKVDFAFLQAPEMNAKIYFKAPDKTKLDSKQFAMLPKQVFSFSPRNLLSFDYSAIFINTQTLNGSPVDVIKIIPNSDTVSIAVATLWIDPVNNVIRRVESTLKKGGTFQFDIDYSSQIKFGLPSAIKFIVDTGNMRDSHGRNSDGDKDTARNSKTQKGTVNIYYSNYKVNKGIPDSIFKDTKNKK